jgi:hypothetical protein
LTTSSANPHVLDVGWRAVLVDLTRKEPTCRPLAIGPPTEAPSLAKTGDWIEVVERGHEELKRKSSEAKEFLMVEPK